MTGEIKDEWDICFNVGDTKALAGGVGGCDGPLLLIRARREEDADKE